MTVSARIAICLTLLALSASAQTSTLEAQTPGYRIRGTVVSAQTGAPLPKIQVAIGRAERAETTQSILTGEDGRFEFGGLRPGKYWLEAQGHGFSRQRFEQHEEYATAVAVGPHLEIQDIVFRAQPDATIDGNVTDEQGEVIREGQVMLFRGGTHDGADSIQLVNTAPIDDQGHYRFGHLPAGRYFLAVSAHPWYAETQLALRPRFGFHARAPREAEPDPQEQAQFDVAYPITYYPGTSDPNSATPMEVGSGQHASADISLAAVPAIHLHISNAMRDPSQGIGANLTQRLLGSVTMPVPGETSDFRNGELEIGGIPQGQYTLSLRGGGNNAGDREKQISVSGEAQIDAADASQSPAISGMVRLDTGEPLPQFTAIRFSDRHEGGIGVGVDAKGRFAVNGDENGLPGGVYEITVAGPANLLVKNVSATGAKVFGREVDISGSNRVSLMVTVSEEHGRVDGTALRHGKPVAGAMIVLVPPDMEHNSSLVRRDQSDSDGTFSLAHTLPGKYTVVAIENGWGLQWLKREVMQPFLRDGQPVEVTAGGRVKITVDVQQPLAP
jgi:hypothetical protein